MTMEVSTDLDLGPLHLEALLGLRKDIRDLRKLLIQDDLVVAGTGTCPTPTASFVFDLGHPSAGFFWQVREIVIGGVDLSQTPAGVGWVVVQATTPEEYGSTAPPITAVRDWTKAALPQNAFYGTHELVVNQMEHLFVVITGGTAGVEYVAVAAVENFPQFVRDRD